MPKPTSPPAEFDPARDLPGFDVARAKRYARIRLAVGAGAAALSIARALWFARSGASARLRTLAEHAAPRPTLAAPLYVATEAVAGWLAAIPIAYWGGYRVERAFGLTKQTNEQWVADQAKALGVGLALQVPLTVGAYRVIRSRPHDWWLVLSGISVPVMVGVSYIAPTVLMPIFNKFQPLEHSELTDRIIRLAALANVPIAAVMTMDMSRQTEKPNAFFAGIGSSKRIVLADTLLEKFSVDEIEGVVAHEVGHQAHGDMWRIVAAASVAGTASAWALSKVAPRWIEANARYSGVRSIDDVAGLPLLQVLLSAGGLVIGPLLAAMSRRIERRTDDYALRLTGDGETYATAMGKLATYSLADPEPPRLLVALLSSHPPIADRIRTARRFDRAHRSVS
jgi:STE24 endopeptidase